jgi:hypothetical protein
MPFGKSSSQPRVSQIKVNLAPVGGLNDIDPLANMGEQYCIQLINWIPGNSALQARQGYREWVTGLDGTVKTLMPYYAMNGDYSLFATTDTSLYDVTLSTDTPVHVINVNQGRFNHTTFGNVGNQYLIAVNGGTDQSLLYDGTSWRVFTETETPVNPGEIKGVDPSKWSHVVSFKRRLWFVENDSMTAWYLPIDATAGEAKPFYLTSVFKKGGKLLYIIDWSVDGGDGLDNKLVFVSNVGEVAVYAGSDPDNADDWAVQAVFYASAPVGDRSFVEFGGDVYMTTTLGVMPLTRILMGAMSQSPYGSAVSRNINSTLNRLILSKDYAANWELFNLPVLQAVVIAIPPVGTAPPVQFVMNSSTGAWARLDIPANTGCLAKGDFYFGTTDGRVCQYGGGNYKDNVKLDGTGGEPVICYLFSAYSYMGDPGILKHWKLIRPIFQSDQPPSYLLTLNVDYDISALPGNPQPPGDEQTNPIWDVAIWDQAFWSSSYTVFRPWVGVSAMGFACALLLKAATNDVTTLVAIEYVYEPGGAI